MATQQWAPGQLYPPGTLRVPRAGVVPVSTAISNPGFESGSTDWTLGANTTVSTIYPFSGTHSLRFTGTAGVTESVHSPYPVSPGRNITAGCQYDQGGAGSGHNDGTVFLRWYDAGMAVLDTSLGNQVSSTSGGAWKPSTVNASAPAGAAYVAIGIRVDRSSSDSSNADNFTWNYATATIPQGLMFKAVQAAAGYSGSSDPVWPTALGVQVVDNEVIWEAVSMSRVTWEADAIMVSGATEPAWPTGVGESVADGSVLWTALSRRVVQAPRSKIVAIAASKVYAGDGDIVRYSATVNPLDWTSEADAGFLPFGLQQYGANPVAAIGIYRSNLVIFNSQAFQMWQVDENPNGNRLLDALPIGSTYHRALCPVSNDLFFLSPRGVRTVGIAAGSVNLAAGDVGMPIDPVVLELLEEAETTGKFPRSTYIPSAGQYWLAFSRSYEGAASATVAVFTISRVGEVGAWSLYEFPFAIDGFAHRDGSVYVRSGNDVLRMTRDAVEDYAGSDRAQGFTGTVQWNWLDMGQPGVNKMLAGFDLVATADAVVSIGYNQVALAYTAPFLVGADTVPGMMIPLPIFAPSMALKLEFPPGFAWELYAANLYLQDGRVTG